MIEELRKELRFIKNLKKKVEKSMKVKTEGSIRSQMLKGKYPQYYHVTDKEKDKYPHGRYLRKTEIELARKLTQKEYDQLLYNELEQQEKVISYFLKHYDHYSAKEIYTRLSEAKQRLIQPYIMTDEQFIQTWMEKTSIEKNTYAVSNELLTEQGEIVRSKSEKMIADKLFYNNIPYKYEAPLRLPDGHIVYPDFTILKISKRETCYLEHLGMMDTPSYCKAALEKIDLYEMNGIYLHENLFITMESSMKAINIRQIDRLIEKHFR